MTFQDILFLSAQHTPTHVGRRKVRYGDGVISKLIVRELIFLLIICLFEI